jgi:hypothetical protein
MSFDKPDDLHSRGTALARLLAEALKSQSKPAGHGRDSSCPDAEVLAAYAEQGLAEEETARWENHFADCDRCQKIIAVLAASGEELAEAEIETSGSLAAASSTARTPVAQNAATRWTMIWRRPVFWRWLVPAAGMASAAVLWLALRQTPPREALSAQKIATTSEAPPKKIAPEATAARSARPDGTQIAQADLPPPPALPPSSEAVLRDKEKAQANYSVVTRQQALKKQETSRSAAQAPPISEADALETREEAAKDNRFPSAQAAEQKSPAGDAPTAAASPAPAAPSIPPPSRVGERAARRDFDTAAGVPSPARLKALAENAVQPIVFGSPNRRALWRLGSGGRIEHSSDEGQTWQPQTSGVTADLLAGAAASEKIAWVVGRGGIIMRTEDGEHWRQVTPPPATQSVAASRGLAPDWIGVDARDTLHATIISRDLRRFVTEDGGRTWVQEQ